MCQENSFSIDIINTVNFPDNVYCFKNKNVTNYLVVSLFPRLILYINFKSYLLSTKTDEEIWNEELDTKDFDQSNWQRQQILFFVMVMKTLFTYFYNLININLVVSVINTRSPNNYGFMLY